MTYSLKAGIKPEDFIPSGRWTDDGVYVKDDSSGRLYLNEPLNVTRQKCAALAIAGPTVVLEAAILQIALNVLRTVTFYHFWAHSEGEYNLKERAISFGLDALRILTAPIAVISMTFAAIFGIINPREGRKLYASIARAQFSTFRETSMYQVGFSATFAAIRVLRFITFSSFWLDSLTSNTPISLTDRAINWIKDLGLALYTPFAIIGIIAADAMKLVGFEKEGTELYSTLTLQLYNRDERRLKGTYVIAPCFQPLGDAEPISEKARPIPALGGGIDPHGAKFDANSPFRLASITGAAGGHPPSPVAPYAPVDFEVTHGLGIQVNGYKW